MKSLFTFLLIFASIITFAQKDFQGKATYKTHRKTNVKIGGEQSSISPDLQKQLEAQMKKMFQKTFVLSFNKSESIYKEDIDLSAPKPQMGGARVMVMSSGGGSDVLYKNIKEKRFSNKTEVMGKRFLITYSREVERRSFSMSEGKPEETKKMETIVTTAWYTPQIPLSNGPEEFGGLPGLILEINDGRLTIMCTEIVLNPAEKISLEEPTKGKIVTQEKFDKIREEKTQEMMERFKSGRRDGNSIQINIGG